MKVMVFTPTWMNEDGQTAILPETKASLHDQVYDGEIEWRIGLHNPFPGKSHRNVLAQFERGRELFLESDADVLLLYEHDMTMPANCIAKMTEEIRDGAAVVYGVYMLRHGSWVLNTFEYIGGRNLGESLSIHPGKLAQAQREGRVRVSGAGFGCTMVRRDVIERFEFHKGDENQWAPDVPFAVDVLQAGLVSVARFDVLCGHYDGFRWLRPFGGSMDDKVTVKVLQSVTVYDGNTIIRLEAGTTQAVLPRFLDEWIRAGYVQPVSEGELETAALEGAPEKTVKSKGRRKKAGGEL